MSVGNGATMIWEEFPEDEYGRTYDPVQQTVTGYDVIVEELESVTGRELDPPDLTMWDIEEYDTSFYRGTDETIVLQDDLAYEDHVLAHEATHALQDQHVDDYDRIRGFQKEGFAQWMAEEVTGIAPLEASSSTSVKTGKYYVGRHLYRAHDAVHGSEKTVELGFQDLGREDSEYILETIEEHGEVPARNLRSIRRHI